MALKRAARRSVAGTKGRDKAAWPRLARQSLQPLPGGRVRVADAGAITGSPCQGICMVHQELFTSLCVVGPATPAIELEGD